MHDDDPATEKVSREEIVSDWVNDLSIDRSIAHESHAITTAVLFFTPCSFSANFSGHSGGGGLSGTNTYVASEIIPATSDKYLHD